MRKSSKNPGGVPDFLYSNPELFGAVDCAKAKPALFENWLQTAFPESECDLEKCFHSQKDEPVLHAALNYANLFPITQENMTEGFLYLRAQRANIIAWHSVPILLLD